MTTLEQKFLDKIQVGISGCWLWTAARGRKGYARFGVNRKIYQAYRWSYEHFIGPIQEGLQLDHFCRAHHCVNPNHLEPVTCKENLLRGDTIQAHNAQKTHCVNGHPFDEKNTLHCKINGRVCRKCRRIRRLKKKASQDQTGQLEVNRA